MQAPDFVGAYQEKCSEQVSSERPILRGIKQDYVTIKEIILSTIFSGMVKMAAVPTHLKFPEASYLLYSGSPNRLCFLCCLCIGMNNLIQGYRIDGYGLLRETEKELAPVL